MKLKIYISILLSALLYSSASFGQAAEETTAPEEATTPETTKPEKDNSDFSQELNEAWANPDYRSYIKAIDELIRMGDSFAENKLRLALSNYQHGKSIIQKMRDDVRLYREQAMESKHLNEKWYWQTMDRKMREERVVSEKKRKAKLKSVTYFTRAINHLDEIDNKRVRESRDYKGLLANIYREWVMAQYDLGNIPQTIDILTRYIALGPMYEGQVAPHKYLSSAYGFQEKIIEKYGIGTEQDLIYFKKKKNEHLLRATELTFKKGSPEYERMMEIVNRDEVIAIQPPN